MVVWGAKSGGISVEGSRGERGWDGTGKSIPTAADIVAGERSFPRNCDGRRCWTENIGVVGD